MDLAGAVDVGAKALAGPDRELPTIELEVAMLRRGNGRRCFHRLSDAEVSEIVAD
jgi:proteasome alpha subunit